jgi:hypothetical protein
MAQELGERDIAREADRKRARRRRPIGGVPDEDLGAVAVAAEQRRDAGDQPAAELVLPLRGLGDLFGGNYLSPPCLNELMKGSARPVRIAPPARSAKTLANRTGCLYYL